ncbi:MAG: hypothetical protein U1F76_19335 [Candidatus Competibacteraceae bacterium]
MTDVGNVLHLIMSNSFCPGIGRKAPGSGLTRAPGPAADSAKPPLRQTRVTATWKLSLAGAVKENDLIELRSVCLHLIFLDFPWFLSAFSRPARLAERLASVVVRSGHGSH